MKVEKTNVLIIGSGAAGYTAGIYAARANLKPILVQGMQPGGQLTITTDVENFPGFADPVMGPWLMEQMEHQASNVGVNIVDDLIVEVDFSSKPFKCISEKGDTFIAESVIIATGAQAKWLGLESEQKFLGYGVSGCATCDAFFYKGKEVVVVGGGNTAVEEALYLSSIASKVILIHRRDSLRAEKILQERLFKTSNIEIMWNHVVDEVLGTDDPIGVTGVRVKDTQYDLTKVLDVHGVFIAVGHQPNTEVFKGSVDMDENGYILVKSGTTKTNIAGVFAAGDVSDKVYRQAITAAGTGCMAALDAQNYLNTI